MYGVKNVHQYIYAVIELEPKEQRGFVCAIAYMFVAVVRERFKYVR